MICTYIFEKIWLDIYRTSVFFQLFSHADRPVWQNCCINPLEIPLWGWRVGLGCRVSYRFSWLWDLGKRSGYQRADNLYPQFFCSFSHSETNPFCLSNHCFHLRSIKIVLLWRSPWWNIVSFTRLKMVIQRWVSLVLWNLKLK